MQKITAIDKTFSWPLGTNVVRCPHCNRPMSYRDDRPFCRCDLRIEKKSFSFSKKRGKAC
jgi:hypothetical protein